jgi:hypothetical protein
MPIAVQRVGVGLSCVDVGVLAGGVVVVTDEVEAADDLVGRERARLDDRPVVVREGLLGAGGAEVACV